MRIAYQISRFIVAGLFLFSAGVKLIDPMGTAIKLEEYFFVFAQDLPALDGFFTSLASASVFFSFLVVVAEAVLGVSILFQLKLRITSLLTFLLIVFFTFLTWYSHTYDKVTDCGCFGDAIKLTPAQSFYKDLILLLPTLLIFLYRKRVKPSFDGFRQVYYIALSALIFFAFALYNYRHLPMKDFRAYKVGTDIKAGMNDGEPSTFKYRMLNLETNEEEVLDEYNMDTKKYKYVDMIEEGGKPPTINDFELRIVGSDEVKSHEILEGEYLLFIIKGLGDDKEYADQLKSLKKEGMKLAIITSDDPEMVTLKMKEWQVPFNQVYSLDATVVKAFIRSNPGLVYLKNGVVMNKWHYNDFPESIND